MISSSLFFLFCIIFSLGVMSMPHRLLNVGVYTDEIYSIYGY